MAAIVCLTVGRFKTNSYLYILGSKALIIDPGFEGKLIIDTLESKLPGAKPDIFLTHGHFDHIMAIPDIIEKYPEAKIYVSEKENMVFNARNNLAAYVGTPFTLEPFKDRIHWVKEGDVINIEGNELRLLDIPGHTPGSIALISDRDGTVFVGDVLFKGGMGRTDYPGGNSTQMHHSIRKLMKLPGDMHVLSGHGPRTTISDEKPNVQGT